MKWLLLAMLGLCSQTLHAQEWLFTAYLDNKEMGYHHFSLTEQGADKTLLSQANFKVKWLFINAYNYEHTAQEKWRNDALQSLQAKTLENRVSTQVSAQLQDNRLLVQGPQATQKSSACQMTFAYWNPAMLKQTQLLNPQTGECLNVKITQLAQENIQVRGDSIASKHYQLEAKKMHIELWYTLDQDWVALKSTTPEGYVVTYQRK